MRIAFISDIHGNAVALESVLKDIKEKNVDKVYVLGDISFRGPEPKRSLQLIRELNTEVIKGNADEWVVRGVQKGEVPDNALDMMKAEGEWATNKLNEEELTFLRELPSELEFVIRGYGFHVFHATPSSLFEAVQPFAKDKEIEKSLFQRDSNIYIYAHIHKPYIRSINGKYVINTGSVGLPFDGLTQSSYALVELVNGNLQLSIRRVAYDLNRTISKFEETDYPNKDFMIQLLEKASI